MPTTCSGPFRGSKAYEIIKKEGISRLPVKPSQLIKNNNYGLITYEKYARLSGLSVLDLVNKHGFDGFTQYVDGNFIVAYNHTRGTPRTRWTLMHELSHIYLGHVNAGCTIMCRGDEGYTQMEQEANNLTAQILCPNFVLHFCEVKDSEELQKIADISREAAAIRWQHLCRIRENAPLDLEVSDKEVLYQFRDFIFFYLEQKRCTQNTYYLEIPMLKTRRL